MMERRTRSRLVVGFGAIAVLGAASVPAVRAEETSVTVIQDVGVLRLHTGADGARVTYSGPLHIDPATQPISVVPKCSANGAGTLLNLVPSGGAFGLGLYSNGFGVRNKNACAPAEGRISGNESLTLQLSSAFSEDVFIKSAELDVEGKFNAKLGVSKDGGPATQFTLASSSDNGPDAGVNDNDRPIVQGPARALTLTAIGGELSLEAGGDGTFAQYAATGELGPLGTSLGTADTILALQSIRHFDQGVDCLESVNATIFGGAATSATFTRQLNDGATSPDDCDDIGVSLHILDEGVLLEKSTASVQDGQPEAVNSQVHIVWSPEVATVPMPAVQINFEGDPNGVFEDVQWCDGHDPDTGYIHPPDARFDDGLLPWCLISESVVLQPDGSVVRQQDYDGKGDPLWNTR
jgi:hypothetical protein